MTNAYHGAGPNASMMAADAARRGRDNEEETTTYRPKDLVEDWEFKILRTNYAGFRDPERLRAVLEYEKQGGWVLLEKFDDFRIRLKRPAARKAVEEDLAGGYDPYRTCVQGDPGALAVIGILIIAALLAIGLIALLLL